MSKIGFSIIVPTYNRANFVVEAINSALNQTYKLPYEVIVVDDGSIDDTEKILLEYMKREPRLKFIKHERNKGLAAARNTGILNSQGEYLLFLDSDDKLLPDALNVFARAVETYSDGDVFIGRIIRENLKSKKLGPVPKISGNNKKDFQKFLKREIPLVAGSFIVKKSIIEQNLFPEEIRLREDLPVYGYLIAMYRCYALKDPVVIIKDHPDRLRKDENLLKQRNLKPLEILFQRLPQDFQNFYSFALSREYLSIFRSYYLIGEYSKAIEYYHKAIRVYSKNLFLISYFKKYLKGIIKSLF
ncbi:MAG: glycosyltransferase [Thermodesulfobacterium sp.]|nr:glycosyltransferase [Thermodesulfobacterium sp.]